MDWSKAKNIIIIALIATNLFLLFTYVTKNHGAEDTADQEVILTVLKGKNIIVDAEIPQKYDKLPAITIAYSSEKTGNAERNLEKNIYDVSKAATEEEYRQTADKFLKDSKIGNENLVFDKVLTEDALVRVIYKNCYKKIVIEGNFVEVIFENGKLEDVTRQFFTPAPRSKKKLNIISPEEALLVFMSEKRDENVIHVENIELVFWIDDSEFNGESLVSETAFPAWEITYNQGMTKYIDAYKT